VFLAKESTQAFNATTILNKVPLHLDIPINGAITGLTVLRSELFVIRGSPSFGVDVYNTSSDYTFIRTLSIPGLSNPMGIVSNHNDNCLYISDAGSHTVH